VPATDSFGIHNQGASTHSRIDCLAEIRDLATDAAVALSVTVAVAFGCPYDGTVASSALGQVLEHVVRFSPSEIALADTIGCAVPNDVSERFRILRDVSDVPMRAHFHDTRGTGLANVQAALDAGVRILDSSVGGLGGCPFAPGASGNVATEDLAWMLHRSGWSTDIDVQQAVDVGRAVTLRLDLEPRSSISRAGVFPP